MSKFTVAMLLIVAAGQAAAAAARVDFAYGNVTVSGPDGREQPLVRGAELDNGDTVRTAEGRAQLRFRDGAYVSLQPGSEFAIRDYRFDGKTDGAERGFFGLTKGAMRTVTGLIGRVNRDRYRVITPTATIGIRGTGGVIQVLNDGSTLIVGTSGIWSLTNPAGSVDVPAGVSALAPATPGAPPQQTSQAPQAGPAPLILPTAFAQGEQRDASGNPAGIPAQAVLASGPGYTALFAYGRADGSVALADGSNATARFNASGQLMQADLPPGTFRLDGTHADFGTDGILAWGRWIGQVAPGTGVEIYSENQGLHYVVGMPTATLPTSGTATYVLAGATRPTYVNGAFSPGAFTGSLSVTFGAQATINTVNWQVAMPDRTFLIANTQMSTQSSNFSTSAIATQGCLSAGCTTNISGFFTGAAAERAGVAYTIDDVNRVIGAAAFRKQ
jgi:FecR-like protein